MRRICLFLILVVLSTTLGGCFFRPRRSVKPVDRSGGTAMIEGQVVDDANRPLPGASVTVMGMEPTALTGPDGKYILTGVTGGTLNLIVSKERYLTGVIPLDLTPTAGRILSTAPVLRLLSTEGSLHMDSARIPAVPGKGPCAQCHQLHNPTDYLPAGGKNDSCYKASCHVATRAAGRFPDRSVFDASPHRLSLWPGQTGSPGNCGSCHEPHGIVNTPVMLRLGQTVSGKRSANDLCYACHENAGSGNTAGWPGKAAYINSSNKHKTITDSGGKYVAGDCLICHAPHGRLNDPAMLRQAVNGLCRSCHASKLSAATGHNGNCVMCHDPHDVGSSAAAVKVKRTNGSKSVLTVGDGRENYRGANLVSNSYCQECHKASPPAGYGTAKNPLASSTRFWNSVPQLPYQTDSNLHNVHVNLVAFSSTTWDTGSHLIVGGDVNKVRCDQCHNAHQTSVGRNLDSSVIQSFSGTYRGGYSNTKFGAVASKSGCGVGGNCHSCYWCHDSPGSPREACFDCSYSDSANSHNDAGIGGHPGISY